MFGISQASFLKINGARSGLERPRIVYAWAALVAALVPSLVQAFDAPVQVDATATVRTLPRIPVRIVESIPGGPATMAATIYGRPGGRAVRVDLAFGFPEPPPGGFFAFTELIEGIELTTEWPDGRIIHKVSIDAGLAALFQGSELFYRATLSIPPDRETIVVRVRVFGNYE